MLELTGQNRVDRTTWRGALNYSMLFDPTQNFRFSKVTYIVLYKAKLLPSVRSWIIRAYRT